MVGARLDTSTKVVTFLFWLIFKGLKAVYPGIRPCPHDLIDDDKSCWSLQVLYKTGNMTKESSNTKT